MIVTPVAKLPNALRNASVSLGIVVSFSWFLALAATSVMLLIASFGIYQFENPVQPDKFRSVFESLWWALATLTTVGYGDIYPITLGGKMFTGAILMIGLGVVALPAGIIASSLTEARKQQGKKSEE